MMNPRYESVLNHLQIVGSKRVNHGACFTFIDCHAPLEIGHTTLYLSHCCECSVGYATVCVVLGKLQNTTPHNGLSVN